MITPERVRRLMEKVPQGHGWVVSDAYPNWVVFWGSDGPPYSVASVEDPNSARLIAAAPEIAQAYLELVEILEKMGVRWTEATEQTAS